jgi:hypothetical protein
VAFTFGFHGELNALVDTVQVVQEVPQLVRPVGPDEGLRTLGIYRISCECGKVNIGQTGCSVDTRLKQHKRHICLEHSDKSPVAEHSIEFEHHIQFHNTSILTTKSHYMDHIIMMAIEIELHPNNMNRETGFCLSKLWKPLVSSFKKISPGHTLSGTASFPASGSLTSR